MKNMIEDMSDGWGGMIIGWFEPEEAPPPSHSTVRYLSARALHCIKNSDWPIDPEFVSKISDYHLLHTPNLGRVTLKEIADWCATHGFPRNSE